MRTVFADRAEAGRLLAAEVAALGLSDPVVLALPRGGVPVAAEVARALGAPLDLLLVRKIGVPWQPELAVAAIVDGAEPQLVIDEAVLRDTGLARSAIDADAQRQLREIERRREVYLHGRAPVAVEGRTAIVIDDGLATGTTMRAALRGLRRRRPAHLVLAVPVAPAETVAALQSEVDRIVCLAQPYPFYAIGAFYRDFHQLDDQEVIELLAAADRPGPAAGEPR